MTDKEQKFALIEINPINGSMCPVLDLSIERAPVCALTNSVPHCKECRKGMTRSEAVQAMVKAVKLLIAKKEFPSLQEECEAALDALISKSN